jgi:hypothetical protein
VHAFAAHVARVRVPAVHDVVICPESEYPELHSGTQLAPDASSVRSAHVPAAALSGLVSFGYVAAVHAFAAHVESVTSPAAEHDVGPDSVYPLAHTGVHDLPAASVPPSQLPTSVPRVGLPVPSAKDTVQSCTHVAFVRFPSEHDVIVCPAIVDSEYPALQSGTQNRPSASAVTPAQLSSPSPAQPLVGSEIVVHVVESAVQTPPDSCPTAHVKGSPSNNSNPSSHAGRHDFPVASTVTPAQLASPSPAQPLVGSEISVHDPTGEQTTFVSVPSLQLACVVDPISYKGVLHVGVQLAP